MRGSSAILFAAAALMTSGDAALAADDPAAHAVTVAKEALAGEIGVDVQRITVATVEAVDWPDGSRGCPRPGMMYTTALVSGHRVVLGVASATYDMRVVGDSAVRCNMAAKPVDSGAVVASVHLAKLARSDLASRLGLDVREVAIDGIRPVRLPDPNLPCPESKDAFTSPTSAYEITLVAKGRSFIYHADDTRVAPCGPGAPAL